MPPKKRGRETPNSNNSKSKSNIQTRKPDPSSTSSDTPSPAPAPARPIAQSLSVGPTPTSAKKALGDGSPSVVPTPTDSMASSQGLTVGAQSDLVGGKGNFKKKVVKRVVRKVKKPSGQTGGTVPESVDADNITKMDLEEANPIVDKVTIADAKQSPLISQVETVVEKTEVVPTEVPTSTSEPLVSVPEPNAEKSSEVKEPESGKGKVKKVIRKVIKKKIVKRMVPKGTLAAKKAAEAALGLAEEQAKLGNLGTNKLGEEKNEGIVHDVKPNYSAQHNKDEIGVRVCENKGDKGEKSNEKGGNSGGKLISESGNQKEGEKSKETVTKIEGDGESNNKISVVSVNKKEINDQIMVGDDSKKMKVDSSASNTGRKVRKVIKKKIIKKLVPKGTLLAKRNAEGNINVAASSEGENCKPKCEGIVNLGEKLETENSGPNKVVKPQQGSITTLSDKIPQNPNFSLNACTKEMDGLTERQKRRKTEIFIGGLDKGVGETDIRTVFGKAGEIVEVRMFLENNTGKNKGYCFLRYKEPTQAKKAISMFSKVEICGKRCGAAPVDDHDSIFLGNIDKRWKKDDIIKLLMEFGIEKIDTVTVMQDPQNPELNRGFAFLDLETNRDAQLAYKKLKAADFSKGLNVRIDWAAPCREPDEDEMLKVKSVFVECIPLSWDKAKMSEIFEKFGKIERVVLARDVPSSKRKDYAFVNYTTREAAISCIELIEKDGLIENGSKVNIKVSLAKPISRGKMTKGGGRPSASEKEKQKKLQSTESSAPSGLRVLREPAPHQEIGYPKGKPFETYKHGLHHEKHGLSALRDDPVYSDMRGLPRPRYDSSHHGFNGSSDYSTGYDGNHLYGRGEPSLYHQNPSFGYASGSHHGKQSYHPSASETRERAFSPHGHRSWPYPRF